MLKSLKKPWRLSKVWVGCAAAKVKANEVGMQGPDCTTAKSNALRANDAVTKSMLETLLLTGNKVQIKWP
jgi:hypothetical protein